MQIVHVNQRNSLAEFKSYTANFVFKIWVDFTLRSTSYKTLQYVLLLFQSSSSELVLFGWQYWMNLNHNESIIQFFHILILCAPTSENHQKMFTLQNISMQIYFTDHVCNTHNTRIFVSIDISKRWRTKQWKNGFIWDLPNCH